MAQQQRQLSWPASAPSSIALPILTRLGDNISGSVFSDQPGTLYIEQSGDNVHWDVSTDYPITANVGQGFVETAILGFAQVRFVPTATLPVTFRLFSHVTSAGGLA